MDESTIFHAQTSGKPPGEPYVPSSDAFASAGVRKPQGRITFLWDKVAGPIYLGLDFAGWIVLYGVISWLRGQAGDDRTNLLSSVSLVQFCSIAFALYVVGGYDRRTNLLSLGYMSEHFIAMLAAAGVGAVAIYGGAAYGEAISPSRGALLISLAVFAPVSVTYRRWISQWLHDHSARKVYVVLGAGELARGFCRAYRQSPNRQRLRVVDPLPGAPRAGLSIDPGNPDAPLVEAVGAADVERLLADSHGVIVAERTSDLSANVMQWLTRLHFADTPVYTLSAFYEKHWRIVPVHTLDLMWPLEVSSQLATQSIYAHVKRLLDITAAILALVLLSPLLVALVLATWLDSGKPALFRQTRIGRDNQPFTIFKFRTMYSRPPNEQGALYTEKKDPRVTRLGYWLRKLRLDELPQLWNVLIGDMSLMGPRAEWIRLAHQYEGEIPFYHFRHLVKPGITGWAQVNYPYGASREDAIEKLKYDLYYIRHCSLRLDAMIVLKTLHIMLWGKGH